MRSIRSPPSLPPSFHPSLPPSLSPSLPPPLSPSFPPCPLSPSLGTPPCTLPLLLHATNPSNLLPQARPETDFLFFEDSPGESTRRMQEGRAQRALMNPEARAGVLCVGELRVLSGMPILN